MTRPPIRHLLSNTAFGIFVGFEFAIILAWIFENDLASAPQLITASAALLGASLAVTGVLSSIDNQNQIAEDQRQRSLAAAKATLPLALTSLSEIAKKGAQFTISSSGTEKTAEELISELSLPKETLSSIQKAIEFASAEDALKLAKIVASFQVLHSRTSSWLIEGRTPIIMHLENSVSWAVLYRQIESCFAYARSEENNIPDRIAPLRLKQFYSVLLRESSIIIRQLQPTIQAMENRFQESKNYWP